MDLRFDESAEIHLSIDVDGLVYCIIGEDKFFSPSSYFEDTLFRVFDRHGTVEFAQYRILRSTPCGKWIRISSTAEKWVCNSGYKRFAYPSSREAVESFLLRKNSHKEHIHRKLSSIGDMLAHPRLQIDIGTPSWD